MWTWSAKFSITCRSSWCSTKPGQLMVRTPTSWWLLESFSSPCGCPQYNLGPESGQCWPISSWSNATLVTWNASHSPLRSSHLMVYELVLTFPAASCNASLGPWAYMTSSYPCGSCTAWWVAGRCLLNQSTSTCSSPSPEGVDSQQPNSAPPSGGLQWWHHPKQLAYDGLLEVVEGTHING